eukprot:4552364-Prymnesium_polylepis.2
MQIHPGLSDPRNPPPRPSHPLTRPQRATCAEKPSCVLQPPAPRPRRPGELNKACYFANHNCASLPTQSS